MFTQKQAQQLEKIIEHQSKHGIGANSMLARPLKAQRYGTNNIKHAPVKPCCSRLHPPKLPASTTIKQNINYAEGS